MSIPSLVEVDYSFDDDDGGDADDDKHNLFPNPKVVYQQEISNKNTNNNL